MKILRYIRFKTLAIWRRYFKKVGCYFCGGALIWGGDFSREDYGLAGDGLVVNLSCPKCGAYVEFTQDEN